MEDPRAGGVCRLKVWFLAILTLAVPLLIMFQASTYMYKQANPESYNTVRMHLVLKGDEHILEKSDVFLSLTTPTVEETTATVIESSEKMPTKFTEQVRMETSKSKDQNNFTAVILLTYMRSGSSLTGDILQQPKDAFYLFEPLKSADQFKRLNRSISFLNGTVLVPTSYDLRSVYLETLLGWLTCNISRIYVESLLDHEFLSLGKNLRPYSKCISRIDLKSYKTLSDFVLDNNAARQKYLLTKCISNLRDACLRSKNRIVKTIRTDMSLAAEVLENIKGSKVIHLVRDPRATIESKSHREVCPLGLTFCIQSHCQRVREDTLRKEKLNAKTLRRVYTVLYENIATKPVQTAKTMYSFTGMEFTPVIAEFTYNVTLGKNKTGCSVCKMKWQIGNSVLSSKTHVEAWKRKLPSKYINRTQLLCNDVIKHYGYEYYTVPYKGKAKSG